jgi:hypothetical protein
MWIYVAATIGINALIVTWATGLNADVGALIALGCIGLGIVAQMADRAFRQSA